MEFSEIITIDGPAASGKTTLGKMIADELGYLFFDTGVMYRAVTWLVLEHAVDIADETRVTQLANSIDIDVRAASVEDGRSVDVLANGIDITWKIRSPEVDASVSQISVFPGVRSALTVQQRRIGLRGKIVMVGRDIGTVVLPEAGLKIYLDASVEERARRRYVECLGRGEEVDYHSTLDSMKHRDQIDSTRKIAPLRPAEDSVCINTNYVPLDQVFTQIMEHIKMSRESTETQ